MGPGDRPKAIFGSPAPFNNGPNVPVPFQFGNAPTIFRIPIAPLHPRSPRSFDASIPGGSRNAGYPVPRFLG